MRGTYKKISLPRRLIGDLMHASMNVPRVSVRRTLHIGPLVKARAAQAQRTGWSTIIAKAFAIAARTDPTFRTLYVKWPWPHFYEVPRSVAMVAIMRNDFDEQAVHFLKIGEPDDRSLTEIDAAIQHGKNAPLSEVPSLNRLMRVSRLPRPLRRLIWAFVLNIGRQRANHAGTFAITSVASFGIETVDALVPGPCLISYGLVRDNTMEIIFHWDHRIYDGIPVGGILDRMEAVMNGEIANEISGSGKIRSIA
jgi:hypothetical protein